MAEVRSFLPGLEGGKGGLPEEGGGGGGGGTEVSPAAPCAAEDFSIGPKAGLQGNSSLKPLT